jgi:NADH dehydrogenase
LGTFIVTGAFGYSGKYIARRLLDLGHAVHTLTGSPDRENPFHGRVSASPFNFDRPEKLVHALAGAQALINTYWVRFDHRDFTHSEAVNNTLTLFRAAKDAGVTRVVHISITKPTLDSDLPYFRGKAELERALVKSGLSYAILRPTVLFGEEDILVNNIAWALRRFPAFALFGNGSYRLQPIYVDDLAALAVEQAQAPANTVIDAIGPETFAFKDLVGAIADTIGKRRPLVSVPPSLGYAAAIVIGKFVGDVFLTREEIAGLMRGLLCTDSTPAGATRLTDWISQHKDTLGVRYASELARRRDRRKSYASIKEGA